MSDFEFLKNLQKELIDTLETRKAFRSWIPHNITKAKIRRLRLQIQEVMLRIERACGAWCIDEPEGWY